MPTDITNTLKDILDPVTFTEWFIKIDTPEGLSEWKLDGYQKRFLRDSTKHRIVNKSKKVGMSTTIAADGIHESFTINNLQIIFVATGQRFARELLGKVYDEVSSMPQAMQPRFIKHAADESQFPNGARMISLPSSEPDHIRGFGLRGSRTDVYLDEHAHVPNDKDLWVVVRDFMRIGGHITSLSTPKGKRGMFYQISGPLQAMYRGLIPPRPSIWSYHEIPWWRCPRHAAEGEASLHENIDDISFQQEYCAEFIDESISFFPFEIIMASQKVDSFVDSDYRTKNPISMGIDFGKKVSETIIWIVEETSPEHFKTIYIEVLPGIDYTVQLETIKSIDKAFRPNIINVDGSGPGGQTMVDFLHKEDFGYKIQSYDLINKVKERIIIRLRMLMEHHRFLIPTKECQYGDKVEMQLHSMQRTTTDSGEHTKYTGKESGGMDDMVWAAALSCFKEYENDFDPVFIQQKDTFLKSITRKHEDEGRLIRQYTVGI